MTRLSYVTLRLLAANAQCREEKRIRSCLRGSRIFDALPFLEPFDSTNVLGGERAGTALFAVAVRSTDRVRCLLCDCSIFAWGAGFLAFELIIPPKPREGNRARTGFRTPDSGRGASCPPSRVILGGGPVLGPWHLSRQHLATTSWRTAPGAPRMNFRNARNKFWG